MMESRQRSAERRNSPGNARTARTATEVDSNKVVRSCQLCRPITNSLKWQKSSLVCGCELFGSQAYLELDAEDQIDVLRAFRQICEEAGRRCDGTIVQCNEQGVLVCFGYPVACDAGTSIVRSANWPPLAT